MSKCKNCANLCNDWCDKVSDSPEENMDRECVRFRQITNAERIRSMSDEELAVKISHQSISSLCDIVCGRDCKAFPTLNKTSQQRCVEIVLDWLKQPAEGETGE